MIDFSSAASFSIVLLPEKYSDTVRVIDSVKIMKITRRLIVRSTQHYTFW